MKNGLIIGTIACMVAVILVGSVLAPVINTTTTTTIKVDNDGAVGLRMEKITTGNFTITFDEVDGEFTATNGSDAQIIDDVCIFYADNNVAVWLDDSSVRMVGVDADNKTFSAVLSDSAAITITKSSEGVNITDGTVDKTFPVPSWSFVPKSTGAYGFFLNETEVNTAGMDTLFVGSFAGVDCYNGINTYNLPIVLDKTASGSTLSGAKWIKAAAEPEELNPDDLHIIPLDPEIITPIENPDASITAVPTPTYTDGDWGYDLITSGAGNGKAKIVSYSGQADSVITIPSTIGGYDVYQIGKGGPSNNVFDFSTFSDETTIIISDGPSVIEGPVFSRNGLKIVDVIVPDSITKILDYSFWGHNFNHAEAVVINENVTNLGMYAYGGAYNYDTLILKPSNVDFNPYTFQNIQANIVTFLDTTGWIDGSTFTTTTPIDILNLGSFDWTTVSNLTTDEIRSDVPALGYLAVTNYNETVRDEGPMAAMFAVIPLIMVIAILMFAVGFTIYRKME